MNVQLVVDHIHCDKTSDVASGPPTMGSDPTQPLRRADLCRYLLITLPTGSGVAVAKSHHGGPCVGRLFTFQLMNRYKFKKATISYRPV